ncbi:flagellar hook assembly protein FlgD [Notoacmeibacter sp. MSK16QG-6]|uniref:flagellar hook assembly protein FlgD n=1 Tax=Notoacmeibacter sp. MSK16QG-6 TaxID=2957982 RepID=UPI00209FE578|nr:flagellar hook assembly protein FlgD [Notoacmeibacter sp. MSK16QG-6]MCP1200940.1 flagellar hook assembly protein FlgD [Notoacmeibacter sp. MSK16QG-6]
MVAVSATQSATATSSTASAAAQNTVDYDMFLQLLVTQMKNQDPTNPADSMDYVAQLANFSNVEQGVQINAKLDQILAMSSLSEAGSLIGRTITDSQGVSGVVSQVRIESSGPVAILENGTEVAMSNGTVIS